MKYKNALILNSNFNEILSEIGGLLYLFERGYTPDVIIATSFSSINATLLSKDPSIRGIKDIVDFYKFLRKDDILGRSFIENILPIKSFYSYKGLERKLRRILPESFKLLRIPTYIIAYNLNSNEMKVFGKDESDNVIKSIISAITIPGIYRVKEDNLVSGNLFPFSLIEFALELGVNNIYYFLGDYNKLSDVILKEYRILLNQNYKEFLEEVGEITSRILIFETKSNRKLFDFSDYRRIVDEGYREVRKKYIYYKLFRYGRVRESLELLKRPDLSEEEKIIKAHAIYLEGDVSEAYGLFNELYEKFSENELVILGYTNTLIEIGEVEQAGKILEGYRNRTRNPYIFDVLSRYYFYRGEIDKAIDCLRIAMDYAKFEPIAYNLALTHYAMAMASLGRSKEAIEKFSEAIDNLRNLDNAYYLSFAYANALNLYFAFYDYQSIEFLKNSIEQVIELTGSSRTLFLFYLNYAVTSVSNKPSVAVGYIKKVIDIAVDKGSPSLLSLALIAMADVYIILGEYEKSELYANEALKIAKENNLFYNTVKALKTLIQSKIVLGKLNEALEVISLLPSEESLPPPEVLAFNLLKFHIYNKLNETEKINLLLDDLLSIIRETKLEGYNAIHDVIKAQIDKELVNILDIKDIISCGVEGRGILSAKLEREPSARLGFLEQLNLEDSIYYMNEIKRLASDQRLRIYVERFAEHWRRVSEQYIATFGDVVYFFNNEPMPISIFGDNLNLLILIYLVANRDKVLTYGDISLTFGIHSENIKERLRRVLDVIEPWSVVQSSKYLIIEEDKVLFRVDENFRVDLHLFEDYIRGGDLEGAISLYRGDFMVNVNHPFFADLRNVLKGRYLDAVYELASRYIGDGVYDRAIIVLEGLLNRDTLNIEHLKLLISTLYRIGKRAYAYEWYLRYLAIVDEPSFKFEEVI